MSSNSTNDLTFGWVPQPDSRGTLNILQSSLLTILICSWSALCLNVPPEGETHMGFFVRKAKWMLFTIFFPEILMAIAAEQWRSAAQSVEDFVNLTKRWEAEERDSKPLPSQNAENLSRIRRSPWTMRHAFFTDMGGLILSFPDHRPFRVDAQQLHYLVERTHLLYPSISDASIRDTNKADAFARSLTLVQISWFSIQAISRGATHLALSTLELSTVAFIFCTINTFFYWRQKPLDVSNAMVLHCPTKLEDILSPSNPSSSSGKLKMNNHRYWYSQNPLDFVKPPITRTSLIAPFWFGVRASFSWTKQDRRHLRANASPTRPIKSTTFIMSSPPFGNTTITPPRGMSIGDIILLTSSPLAYFGIHLAGWNFEFPTHVEKLLWRISSLTLLGLLVFYLVAIVVGTFLAEYISRVYFKNNEEKTILGVASLLPKSAAFLLHFPVVAAYCIARTYIIVEGFVNLRALPSTAFESVNWPNFVPHF